MRAVTREVAKQSFEEYLGADCEGLDKLIRFAQRMFPSLKQDAEDLVQNVLQSVLGVLQNHHDKDRWAAMQSRLEFYLQLGKNWPQAWMCYLKRLIRWRGFDRLRQEERKFLILPPGEHSGEDDRSVLEPPSPDAPPDLILEEAGRRQRQVHWLSDIFRQFVAWCESRATGNGLVMKQVYERRLRGQKVPEIMAAMGLSRNHVDVLVKRARDWILQQIDQRDVHKSVFLTLRGAGRRQQATAHAGSGFSRFEDVLDFVINEMGALCPSVERLWHYVRQPGAPEFDDIRYHVEQVHCRLCRAELGA
ncbi:MAG: hypothetical protein RMI91_08455 [Gemmatales bacterium]|nr:hypothetical protein [Gemmatales bacterium]MDW7994671.1 hypothetical protein [Gemmatales bacterium]